MDDKHTLKIEISNLTEAQCIAIEDMLRVWEYLGNVGSSKWTCFYADGDGNFRPKVLINNNKPKRFRNPFTKTTIDIDKRLFNNEDCFGYKIDFDEIAWLLHEYKKEDLQL